MIAAVYIPNLYHSNRTLLNFRQRKQEKTAGFRPCRINDFVIPVQTGIQYPHLNLQSRPILRDYCMVVFLYHETIHVHTLNLHPSLASPLITPYRRFTINLYGFPNFYSPLPSSPAEALAKEGDPSLHSSQLATSRPHPSKRLRLLSGLAILILGIFVGFFGSNLLNPSTNQSALAPTESLKDSSSFSQLTASPTPTIDPIAIWRTYTDSKYGFEFKYPSEEKI